MASFTWNAASNTGDWSSASSWTPAGGPPGSTDTATFDSLSSSYTANVNGETITVEQISINSTTGNAISLSIASSGAATLTTGTLDYLTSGSHGSSTITVNNSGTFDVTTSVLDTNSVAEMISVSGKGGTKTGGLLELGSTSVGNLSSLTLKFNNQLGTTPNDGVIKFDGTFTAPVTLNEHIANFSNGDALIFNGANFTGDTVALSGGVLTVKDGGTTVLTISNLTSGGTKFAETGNEIMAVCYVRGTMIRTPDGQSPVEKLRPGKQVLTQVGDERIPQTVRWLGHRRIALTAHPRPETVAPIRIQRGAFGEARPQRDLLVSPDHAIFVDGKLICARQLINETTIIQEHGWTAVDYYHVQLDRHAILLAEGLPAESYIDTGNSGFFDNSGAPLVLHPDLTDESSHPTRESGSCAPFVWDEASVRPVWQRLADRAAAIGKPVPQRATTVEADLRLVAKGRSVRPIHSDSNLVIFALPRGASEVRLHSRAQPVTKARPWLEDRRRLGVRVARIVLRSAHDTREIPVDHPGLRNGWWAVERDGRALRRWTDGDAAVPLPSIDGEATLEVHLAGAMTYVVEDACAA